MSQLEAAAQAVRAEAAQARQEAAQAVTAQQAAAAVVEILSTLPHEVAIAMARAATGRRGSLQWLRS